MKRRGLQPAHGIPAPQNWAPEDGSEAPSREGWEGMELEGGATFTSHQPQLYSF